MENKCGSALQLTLLMILYIQWRESLLSMAQTQPLVGRLDVYIELLHT